jgi:hypothetical protein
VKITATGKTYLGVLVTRTLVDDNVPRHICRFGSGMDIGDDTAYEPVEFVDAATLQFFPRKLVSRPWSVMAVHEFNQSSQALAFWMDLRRLTPEQADLVIEEQSMRRRMLGVIIRMRCPAPRYGLTVKVNYEFLGGDFIV